VSRRAGAGLRGLFHQRLSRSSSLCHIRLRISAHFLVCSFSGALAPCVFLLAELFAPKKLDQWPMGTLLASTCGTLFGAALLATVAIVRRVRQPPGVSAPSP
jgi:hypothetical protein